MLLPDSNISIVVGLGYGDEGKGSIVDYLVRLQKADLVVRFNGGPQAAHNVVSPEGITHCFSQFGSGTLVPGVETFLSRFMFVDPLAIFVEDDVLRNKSISNAMERLIIDRDCPIVTPFHKIVNQMREISRGDARHGSCGMGVGEAAKDLDYFGQECFFIKDILDRPTMIRKLNFLRECKIDIAEQIFEELPDNEQLRLRFERIKDSGRVSILAEVYSLFVKTIGVRIKDGQYLAERLSGKGSVVFEGAQGVLLNPKTGPKPYVTKTDTTLKNAEELIAGSSKMIVRIGISRAYMTRHGLGPFVTEDKKLTEMIPDCHNLDNEWQGKFRIGWFDLVAARYALKVAGDIDCLAITNLDRLTGLNYIPVCTSYRGSAEKCEPVYSKKIAGTGNYIRFLERELKKPISIVSFGPSAREKKLK